MPNAFVKIGTALFKHQIKKLVGEETLGVISDELADIGGDKLDAWLGDKSTLEEIEKAAATARDNFRGKINDNDIEQWMAMLPIDNLPDVLEAIKELPTSPDETKLENALRESIALNWKKLSSAQVDNAVNAFLTCLRSALLPIEKQTLMMIGRSVLRTEDKVDLLLRWFEQYIITGKRAEIKQLNPEPIETWNLKHPYAMPPNFTGRVDERKMLVDWLNKADENRLFILRALGGFGKSALSWHWLTHDIDSKEWNKILWWSFYEGDVSFEHFIEETLKYLNLEVPQGQRPQVDALLKAIHSQKILLIMDGFERALRAYSSMNAAYQGDESPLPAGEGQGEGAYDCVNINAEIFLKSVCSLPNIKSKILMTTRLTPRAIKPRGEFMLGCREVELTSMQPADAVEFFHKQGIKGTHAEIEAACAPYGYHPLSLRLLAGRILKDFENPADIVVAQKLKIDGDLKQYQHHVLEVSYNSLPPHEQKLLSTIACFRSPVEHKTLEAIAENKDTLDDDLRDLVEHGLLHFDEKNKKFDLHPIVRHYAYDHFTDEKRRKEAHVQLAMYFIDVMPVTNKNVKTLEDLAPVIELYYHMVRAGNLDEAKKIFKDRLNTPTYFQFGAYQLQIELLRALFLDGDDKPPRLKTEDAQAQILNDLAGVYSLSGQSRRVVPLAEMANALMEKAGDKKNLAIGLGNMAIQQLALGALREAEFNLRSAIEIDMNIQDHMWEGENRENLALLLSYCNNWKEAEKEFTLAISLLEKTNHVQGKSVVWSNHALCFLLIAREGAVIENLQSSIKCAQRALELADETARDSRFVYPIRDYICAYWLLGAAYRANGDLTRAEENLPKAINMCRKINLVEVEANILLDLARLRYAQGDLKDAQEKASEALVITERSGYVLQGADVNLFLAQYALEQEQNKVKAKAHADEALKLATCDGPPYYYKVAYEEAERLLASLNV